MKRLLVTLLLIGLVIGGLPARAQAHVFITDKTESIGAVVHIVPDDDPIAGQPAKIFFDPQTDLLALAVTARLRVENVAGETELVVGVTDGKVAIYDYTFPSQGAYKLTFVINSNGQDYSFLMSQRVSRGTLSGDIKQPTYTWAELTLLASGILAALLLILFINRRRAILRQSQW